MLARALLSGLALVLASGVLGCATAAPPPSQPPCACNAPQAPPEQRISGGGHIDASQ